MVAKAAKAAEAAGAVEEVVDREQRHIRGLRIMKNKNGNVKQLLQDLMPCVTANELFNATVLPLHFMSKSLENLSSEAGSRRYDDTEPMNLPAVVWSALRDEHPEVTVFPLGMATERAVKRLIHTLVTPLLKKPDKTHSSDNTYKQVEAEITRAGLAGIRFQYLCYFIYEAASMNLRGSSSELSNDYGFLYHYSGPNKPLTLREESELSEELMKQSIALAKDLIISINKSVVPGELFTDPYVIAKPLISTLGARPACSPEWLRDGSCRPLTVLGIQPTKKMLETRHRIAEEAKLIALHGDVSNVELDRADLIKKSGNELHSLLQDLLEIATIAYMADIHMPRGHWFDRDMNLMIPVRHPEIWKQHEKGLTHTLTFLSGNLFSFEFVKLKRKRNEDLNFKVDHSDNRAVALFSGGLDSFVGATQLIKQGRTPWLVSHPASHMLSAIQKRLIKTLKKQDKNLVHVPVPAHAKGKKEVDPLYWLGSQPRQELIQYTRSFLFMAMAACLAIQNGIGEIYIHENGLVALNPSFSEARFNTRTAHPTFIRYFRQLINDVFSVDLKIINPFANMTKGEVVATLDKEWHIYIKSTNSCWAYVQAKAWAINFGIEDFKGGHCGRCIPCVWRRAALQYAELEQYDDDYLIDDVGADKSFLNRTHFTLLMDLWRFCWNVGEMTDDELLYFCPDLWEGDGAISGRLQMVRKHAEDEILPFYSMEKTRDKYVFRM